MTNAEYIKIIDQLMPEIAETRDPGSALLKTAQKDNWPPAILKRAAHIFNGFMATYSTQKKATGDMRGANFSLLDPDELTEKYESYSACKFASFSLAAANDKLDPILEDCYKPLPFLTVSAPVQEEEKQASTEEDKPVDFYRQKLIKQAKEQEANNLFAENQLKLTEATDNLLKIASEAWTEVYQDIAELLPPRAEGKSGLDIVCDRLNTKLAYSSEEALPIPGLDSFEKRMFPYDRHGVLKYASDIVEAYDGIWEACLLHEKCAGSYVVEEDIDLGGMPEVRRRVERERGAYFDPEYAAVVSQGMRDRNYDAWLDAPAHLGNGVIDLLGSLRGPRGGAGPVKALTDAQDLLARLKPTKNIRQMKADQAALDAKRQAVFQEVVLSDPLLAGQDPLMLAQTYETIKRTAPNIADQPKAISQLLRYSAQYDGALPLNILNELSNVEKSQVSAAKDRADLESRKYAL